MEDTNPEDSQEFTEIYVWGNDYYGQLGVGLDQTIHHVPKVCSFNIVINQVSCGDEHTVFAAEQEGLVYCMGSNQDGKLGVGEKTLRNSNVPCLVEGLSDIKQVACGSSHTLALSRKGEVFSWGSGFYGALGVGEARVNDRPQAIRALQQENVIDIAAGSRHSLFLCVNQRVYASGESKSGQLGLGQSQNLPERVLVPSIIQALNGQRINKVCCGKLHSMFLTQQKEVYVTGANNFGQLGNGTKASLYVPEKIKGLSDVRQMSAWQYSAAITHSNQLYVWGTGIFGEFLTPQLSQFSPDKCPSQYDSVHVGGNFTVLIDKDRKPYVWGANTSNEIGTGDSQPQLYPALLTQIEDKQVFGLGIGNNFAFALGQKLRSSDNYQSSNTEEVQNSQQTEYYVGTRLIGKYNETSEVSNTYNTEYDETNRRYQNPSLYEQQQQPNNNQRDTSQTRQIANNYRQIQNEAAFERVLTPPYDYQNYNQRKEEVGPTMKHTISHTDLYQNYKNQPIVNAQSKAEVSNSTALLEKKIQDLTYQNHEQERTIKLLKDDNARLQQNDGLKQELEAIKKSEAQNKVKLGELEGKFKDFEKLKQDYQQLKDENVKLKRDNDDLTYKLTRAQQQQNYNSGGHKHHKNKNPYHKNGDSSNNTTTIDFNSPGQMKKLEEDLGSPITTVNQNDLTTLKIEDLDEGKKGYNPVWRLQITDDKNMVKYDGKFLDRNQNLDNFGVRDIPNYTRINHYDYKPQNLEQKYQEIARNEPNRDRVDPYALPRFGVNPDRYDIKTQDRYDYQRNDYKRPAAAQDQKENQIDPLAYLNKNNQVFSDDRGEKKQRERLYDYENRKDYEEALYKRQFQDVKEEKTALQPTTNAVQNQYNRPLPVTNDYQKHYEPVSANRHLDYKPQYVPATGLRNDYKSNNDYEPVYNRKDANLDKQPANNPPLANYQPASALNKPPATQHQARQTPSFINNYEPVTQNNVKYEQPISNPHVNNRPNPTNQENNTSYQPTHKTNNSYNIPPYVNNTKDDAQDKFRINLQLIQPQTNPTSPLNRNNPLSPINDKNLLNPNYVPSSTKYSPAPTDKLQYNPQGQNNIAKAGGIARVDEIRQKLDKFKQQREETGKLVQNYRK